MEDLCATFQRLARRVTSRRTRKPSSDCDPQDRWLATIPADGDDARCIYCRLPTTVPWRGLICTCRCAMQHGCTLPCCDTGDHTRACPSCTDFVVEDMLHEYVLAGESSAHERVLRAGMRKKLGVDDTAEAMIVAQALRRGRAGRRCLICSRSTKNGHSGFCNACRNVNFVRGCLRRARAGGTNTHRRRPASSTAAPLSDRSMTASAGNVPPAVLQPNER